VGEKGTVTPGKQTWKGEQGFYANKKVLGERKGTGGDPICGGGDLGRRSCRWKEWGEKDVVITKSRKK